LGQVLYTDYILLFQLAGLVLLVAMIGAIVLTLRDRQTSRHQDIARQTAEEPAMRLSYVRMAIGAGVAAGDVRRPRPRPAAKEPETIEPTGGGHH
jgi:NADH-quinone oxidoreductase subunit J